MQESSSGLLGRHDLLELDLGHERRNALPSYVVRVVERSIALAGAVIGTRARAPMTCDASVLKPR
jgi:hypothetical protein